MPDISVIVPVYEVEPYLCRCLDSILNQSFFDFELILVDDGSPDRCGEICDEYAANNPRITVIHQKNGGLSAARNSGLAIAKCEWVCFVDSDDCIHPNMLEHMYRAAKESDVGMVICDCVQAQVLPEDFFSINDTSFKTITVSEAFLLSMLKEDKRLYWTVVPVLVKTAIAKKHFFTEGRIYEDNAVSVSWLYEAKQIAVFDAKFYFYMTNPNGIVNEAFSQRKFDFLWALEQQMTFFEQVSYYALLKEIGVLYIRTAIWFSKRAIAELNNKKLARIAIKKAYCIKRKYAAILDLSEEDKRKLFKAAHPILHRIRKHFSV